MNKKIIICTLMGCLFGATVGYSASVVNLPHTFAAGTSIKASEVNANFAALAQEIADIKETVSLNKYSAFTEMEIAPISTLVGSTITLGSNSFIIKQLKGEDPLTGKKYTLTYPSVMTGDGYTVFSTNCKALLDTQMAIRLGKGNGFTSYVSYYSSSNGSPDTRIYIQVGDFCTLVPIEKGKYGGYTEAKGMIDRATEAQRYISVQEI